MAPEATKLRLTIGNFSVFYEGPDSRLEDGLAVLVKEIASVALEAGSMISSDPKAVESPALSDQSIRQTPVDPLSVFLRQQSASTQIKRFLTTAVWVGLKNGQQTITIADVTSALRDNQQPRLSNPSECLNSNIKHGYCERVGKGRFHVTQTGRQSLNL